MKGKALWDIKTVRESWQKPFHEYAFIGFIDNKQKILPSEYQADNLRRFQNVLIVKDQLLGVKELDNIQKASKYMNKTVNWSTNFKRDEQSGIFLRPTVGRRTKKITEEEVVFIEDSMQQVVNFVWSKLFSFLITEPENIHYVHAWINVGPLHESQSDRYHFTHYDCDDYLEISKGLFRFPPYAAVFYIDISPDIEGGVTWFPEIKQGVIPKTNRLAIFDASLAHAVLPAAAPKKTARSVMVMNVWDYKIREEQVELTNGILGFTKNRRDELQWIP
jgi:hypothetical protein